MADPIDINTLQDQTLADGGYVFMIHKSGSDVTGSLLPATELQVVAAAAAAALKPDDVGEVAYLNEADLPGVGGGAELEAALIRILALESQVEVLLTLVSAGGIPIYEDDIYEDDIYVT